MTSNAAAELLSEREYDAIIVGTGLTESILAAALASSGSSILHLDPNHFYGGAWATLNLSHIEKILSESTDTTEQDSEINLSPPDIIHEIESVFGPGFEQNAIPQLPFHSHAFPEGTRVLTNSWSSQESDAEISLLKNRIWLDLVPRPVMAAGSMIDLLIQTKVGHYIDFRALDALYLEFGQQAGIQRVPSTRSDVFKNRFVSMIEKRLLMRFVKNCIQPHAAIEDASEEKPSDVADGSFEDAIHEAGLTENLQRFLTYSIAFSNEGVNKDRREGVNAVQKYQESMSRFRTPTPFLYPNYGSGELSQAFCRLCAVQGGVYVLRRGATAVIRRGGNVPECSNVQNGTHDNEHCVGVVTTENEVIRSKHVFISSHYLPDREENNVEAADVRRVWRLMAVISDSISRDEDANRIMLTIPRDTLGNVSSTVRIRQLDSSVFVCPASYFVLYAETIDSSGTEDDLLAAIRHYVHIADDEDASDVGTPFPLEDNSEDGEPIPVESDGVRSPQAHEKPTMVWGLTYAREVAEKVCDGGDGRIIRVCAPEVEHDTDKLIREAKRCFSKVKREEEFFPSIDANASEANNSEEGSEQD